MSDEEDEAFALWVSRLSDRLRAGERLELGAVLLERPDWSDLIREVWPIILLTEMAGEEETLDGEAENGGSDSSSSLAPYPTHFGDFELIEELGRGGMGIVYRARQRRLGREVALKLILIDHLTSGTERARFYAEAKAAARLEHPHIVPVYELGEHDGRPFLCMKLIEGETLLHRLARGPMTSEEAARLLVPLCRAVQYAHDNSVLHRDIKPSNILIDQAGSAILTDFGLAKDLRDPATVTRTGAVVGTPAYMSPEQAAGGRPGIDTTSDVYSLGAVLYHMVTGRPPFQGRTGLETVLMVLDQDPPSPRSVQPKVDRDLEMIILRCLQKPSDLRYASPASLADDLEAFLRHDEISARSGRFTQVVALMFRETHHVVVLENWGLLWMWHSLVLLVVCLATNLLQWTPAPTRTSFFLLWTLGLWTWAAVFWALRRRMGPVTFVERQIAHLWAASMIATATLYPLEALLGLPPLQLSPVVPLFAATTFLVKAAILSGRFYIQAVALFATSLVMAFVPDFGHLIMGAVTAVCFFIPGLRFHRARKARQRDPNASLLTVGGASTRQ
ncbi:MAG: serine/threonine protein kinase [Planctomycetales bacterium]|nr:serine/threonine protein kinase [Planctomycetales bacterium]